MNEAVEKSVLTDGLDKVPFSQRVLLLPHCLRPTLDCLGRMTKQGLECGACDREDCAIYLLRTAAVGAGYGGICVAPGGRLAARFVAEHQPSGVVAVACHKELAQGYEAVGKMALDGGLPASAVVPLLVDGCVDTQVDVAAAISVILSHAGDDGR
jgi:hypothetical protein